MRTIKKIKGFRINILFLVVFGLLFSCSTEENETPQKEEFNLEYLLNKDFSDLVLSSSIRMNNLSENLRLLNRDSDDESEILPERFVELLEIEDLTSEENIELDNILNYLGFNNRDSFNSYSQNLYNFTVEIVEETNYLELDEEVQQDLLTDFFNNNYAYRSCIGIYDACRNHAHAVHTVGIIGCTTASVAFIAFSGPGALLLQSFCLAANGDLYRSGLGVCKAAYEDCL